jgi:hypothetical protein
MRLIKPPREKKALSRTGHLIMICSIRMSGLDYVRKGAHEAKHVSHDRRICRVRHARICPMEEKKETEVPTSTERRGSQSEQ